MWVVDGFGFIGIERVSVVVCGVCLFGYVVS